MKLTPVRIGAQYQAELPDLLPPPPRPPASTASSDAPAAAADATLPSFTQRWTPSRFSSDEVTEFLRSFCRLNEVEMGLQCLMQSDFHVENAVQLLHAARRAKARAQRAECERMSDEAFGSAVTAHGKRFFVIQRELEHVTTGDIVRRFYLWKTSNAYRIWRERAKARRGKESARLRSWEESEESEASDFHNEYCELCFTGGQLLCCDGCERAYHFSCVSPPINEVPTGDWFCAHCVDLLETNVRVKQSAENAHCNEVVALDEESDVDTLDLEEIDDDDEEEDAEGDESKFDVRAKIKTEAVGSRRRTAQESPPRASSSTDNDESDGSAKTEARREKRAAANVRVKPESRQQQHLAPRRLSDARRFASPAKPALVLEPSSSERKRKRKIEAPRRIPQQQRGIF